MIEIRKFAVLDGIELKYNTETERFENVSNVLGFYHQKEITDIVNENKMDKLRYIEFDNEFWYKIICEDYQFDNLIYTEKYVKPVLKDGMPRKIAIFAEGPLFIQNDNGTFVIAPNTNGVN